MRSLRVFTLLVAAILLLPASALASRPAARFQGASAKSATGAVTAKVEADGQFRITRTADGEELGRGKLPLIPGLLLVADSGDHLVLLDTWGRGADDAKGPVLRILDGNGTVTLTRTLQQLFSPEVRAGFPQSVLGPVWRADAWIDDELGVLALISAGPRSGFALPSGVSSVAVMRPDAATAESASPPEMLVLSLQDGTRLEPWHALQRRLADSRRSRGARNLIDTPGTLPLSEGTLKRLWGEDDAGLRPLAVELSLRNDGSEANEVLAGALADCDVSGMQRTRAARTLLQRGDRRGAPVLLRATGTPLHRALAGATVRGLCLKDLKGVKVRAEAVPALPELLGEAAERQLLRLLKRDASYGRLAGSAALRLLLERDGLPRAWRDALTKYARCTSCDYRLRTRTLVRLNEADPAGAIALLESMFSEEEFGSIFPAACEQLGSRGSQGKAALLRLLEDPRRPVVITVLKELLVRETDPATLKAIGDRLLRVEAGKERQAILSSLVFSNRVLPVALIDTLVTIAKEAEDRLERGFAFDLLQGAGDEGRAALRSFVSGSEGVAAAVFKLSHGSHDGRYVADAMDICVEALHNPKLSSEDRRMILGIIHQVALQKERPEASEQTVALIAEVFSTESDPQSLYYGAQSLAHLGPYGRTMLARLLLRFPDDGSDHVKKIIEALRKSVLHDVPSELVTHPGSSRATSKPARWRAWAAKQLP